MPEDLESVATVPAVDEFIVKSFPEDPAAVKFETVCVVDMVKVIVVAAALYVFPMFENVLDPLIVNAALPP